MSFNKENLLKQHYHWESPNGAFFFTGTPSRRLFDRFNGQQVLFIINLCLDAAADFPIEEGQKIETMISNQLPLELQSEITVFNWLQTALPNQ